MFGKSVDLAIPSGPWPYLALPSITAGKAVLVVGLCDCRWLRVEDDPVCGATQVLPDLHLCRGLCHVVL
ncbi:MAG: hypothetical protein GDA36_14140 [Rhodobacteraceae bacterium]|nr:hypothetical protein [Paracoccaceae bacterium]